MKKIILLLIFMLGIYANVFAFEGLNLNFNNLGESFLNKFMGIHFNGGGNNFGGVMIVNGISTVNENITVDGKTIVCKGKLDGYYYNNMHGAISFPLNEEVKNLWSIDNVYNGLNISGGLYTLCEGENIDDKSVIGMVTYKVDNKELFRIYAGFEGSGNKIDLKLKNNLQFITRDDKKYLMGLLYDSSYGLGMVGAKVIKGFDELVEDLNGESVDGYITSINGSKILTINSNVELEPSGWLGALSKIFVGGLMSLSSNKDNKDIVEQYRKDARLDKTLVLNQKKIKIFNKLRKDLYLQCRGNFKDIGEINLSNRGTKRTICIKGDNKVILLNGNFAANDEKLNVIVFGKNNTVLVKDNQYGNGNVNIFVEKGFVLFNNNVSNLLSLDGNGKVVENDGVTKGFVYNGDIVVGGLIGGYELGAGVFNFDTNMVGFKHKLYINGSLLAFNSIGYSEKSREYIQNKFKELFNGLTPEQLKSNNVLDYVDIMKSFAWQCVGTEGIDGANCSNANDKYATRALIIRKRRYENSFIK